MRVQIKRSEFKRSISKRDARERYTQSRMGRKFRLSQRARCDGGKVIYKKSGVQDPAKRAAKEAGVVPAFWWNLVGKVGAAPHYYTPSTPRVRVKVPTHLLLLAGFDTPAAQQNGKGSRSTANIAAAKGGVMVCAT